MYSMTVISSNRTALIDQKSMRNLWAYSDYMSVSQSNVLTYSASVFRICRLRIKVVKSSYIIQKLDDGHKGF